MKNSISKLGTDIRKGVKNKNIHAVRTSINIRFCHVFPRNTPYKLAMAVPYKNLLPLFKK